MQRKVQARRPTLPPVPHTSYASVGRDACEPYIVTDVRMHNTDNTNNCGRVSEEAHCPVVFLSEQYGLGLVNLDTAELRHFETCSCNEEVTATGS
jgi:hypothetical protein